MNEKGIIQFQSLSRCEASQMCDDISHTILHAYATGMNVVVSNYDKPFSDLFMAHRDALNDLGFGNMPFSLAMEMIEFKVKPEVSDE